MRRVRFQPGRTNEWGMSCVLQLEQYQTSQMASLHERRLRGLQDNRPTLTLHPSPSGFFPRSGMYFADGKDEKDGEDVIDYPFPKPIDAPPSLKPPEAKLHCPRCPQEFSSTEHTALLEHIDDCCE